MRRFISTAIVLGIAATVLLGASACDEPALPVVNAQLIPPPGVPQALHRTRSHVVVRLEALEKDMEIAPGVTYRFWTFNGTVPGPLIRVHEGDEVELFLTNNGSNSVTHNIDLHAATGPGGGAGATTVAPGETKSFTFKTTAAGLFVYHCAVGFVADHIANGMYGAILVEPSDGLPKVDHEFYVGQSDLYTSGDTNDTGHQDLDINKVFAEQPTYVVFNANTKSLNGDNALQAKTGETVRIYFADGGPNLTSSFHVIGEIFDKAWAWGTFESLPIEGVQTISVPPGGATVVQFKVEVPGDYKLVDHAIGRVSKGAVGTLHVTGDNNPDIFSVNGSPAEVSAAGGHDMTGTSPTPAAGTPSGGPATALKVDMQDNFFNPKQLTATSGSSVTFNITNAGKVPHNMRIAPLNGDFNSKDSVVSVPEFINVGKTGKLDWKAGAAGTYKFQCDLHPTEMTGTITVQ